MEERLNKALSALGVCSRREADRLIEAGQVFVDGHRAQMGEKVRPGQQIGCQGRTFIWGEKEKPPQVLLAVNKPRGVVCSASHRDRAQTIQDLIQYPLRVYYMGRLDKDSEGLVLMTNQGDLVNKVMRSGNAHEKEYLVTVDRPVTKEFLRQLEQGVYLEELERRTLPCRTEQIGPCAFRIVLTQGLNRQIRRMCQACGWQVYTLKRVRIMNIFLGDLKPGAYRQIQGPEYEAFLEALKGSTNQSWAQSRGHS